MRFTNFFRLSVVVLAAVVATVNCVEEDSSLLYSHTRVCSGHNGIVCMSQDKKTSMVHMSRKHRMRFEIETIERINMKLNRVYTKTTDKSGNEVKNCLVRSSIEKYGIDGVSLATCDTNANELVLAVDTPLTGEDIKIDEFALKEISYLEDGTSVSSELCLTTAFVSGGILHPVAAPRHLNRKNLVVLTDCSVANAFAQDFKARHFDRSASSRVIVATEEPAVQAKIGRFCLTEKPDLCLGVSLKNGTTLMNDVFVQVKNYTKNEAKNLHDLKMRWYHDVNNGRIASAAKLDYCIESVYGASIGYSRSGQERFDDIVHLGYCDASLTAASKDGGVDDLPSSEQFFTETMGTHLELRTEVPADATTVDGDRTKCISIVRCVRHDNDHCTKYNSFEVYDAEDLEQGAHARLKDCNSAEMASQRFTYIEEDEITMPPTNYPTPKPQTLAPTVSVTTESPTELDVEPIATSSPTSTGGGSTNEQPINKPSTQKGVFAGLAFVGLLCIAIIIVGVAYYYKHRAEFAGTPEEDENFIARV